jgi:hypothetical protein
MAWQVVQAVLRARITPPARKLVAVALAEHANKDGTRARPGMKLLRIYTGLSERRVLAHIGGLIDEKIVTRVLRGHEDQRAEFRFHLDRLAELEGDAGDTLQGDGDDTHSTREGDAGDSERVTDTTAEGDAGDTPSVMNRQGTTLAAEKRAAREGIFAALVEAEGANLEEITESHRGALNKVVKQLLAVGATPDDVDERAERYREAFPRIRVTATGLAKHWASLGPEEDEPSSWIPCQGMDCDQPATIGLYCDHHEQLRRRAAGGQP